MPTFWLQGIRISGLALALLAMTGGVRCLAQGSYWSAAPQPFPGRDTLASCVFNGKIWISGGSDGTAHKNDVWSSPDGLAWTRETPSAAFSVRVWHAMLALPTKMVIIGGYNGPSQTNLRDVWQSTDGVNWTLLTAAAAFPARTQSSAVVFQNKLWIFGGITPGGLLADVWSSDDGINWTQATAAAAFGGRAGHRSVVFNNKMWIVGGYDSANPLSDAWWSTDGITWTRATAAAGFSGRWGHELAATGTMMVVMGGCGGAEGTNLKNDVWFTLDGTYWSEATAAAPFSPRFLTSSASIANHIWLLGGRISGGYTMAPDSVWHCPLSLVPVELSRFKVE